MISSAAQVVCKRIHSAQRQTAKTSLECLRHPGCLALPELYKAPRSTGMWRRSNTFSCCLHSLFHFMKRIATVLCKTAQPYFSDRSYQCYHCLHRKEQIEKVFRLSFCDMPIHTPLEFDGKVAFNEVNLQDLPACKANFAPMIMLRIAESRTQKLSRCSSGIYRSRQESEALGCHSIRQSISACLDDLIVLQHSCALQN